MSGSYPYRVSRRTTLKWMVSTLALSAGGCSRLDVLPGSQDGRDMWPMPDVEEPAGVNVAGYGTDPDLIDPIVPWPRIMTGQQHQIAEALADMIIPADAHSPSASAVGVPEFIDEWVSAPYPLQEADREIILNGLLWLEHESISRFARSFHTVTDDQRSNILDRIAYKRRINTDLAQAAHFFGRFRYLAVGAFYTTQSGMADIRYAGNTPVTGQYPGPSAEALQHMLAALHALGLDPPPDG